MTARAAGSMTNTQKLDEIINRLNHQPTTEQFRELSIKLDKTIERLDHIASRVDSLDKTVFGNGDGKPGMKMEVHDLQKSNAIINRVTWIVVGVIVTAMTYGIINSIGGLP